MLQVWTRNIQLFASPRPTSSEPELREGVHGVVYEQFSPLNPQMWGPARGQHPGNVGSVMFNPAPRRCGFATVSGEPESQLQTAQFADSLESRARAKSSEVNEVAPSCEDGGSRQKKTRGIGDVMASASVVSFSISDVQHASRFESRVRA